MRNLFTMFLALFFFIGSSPAFAQDDAAVDEATVEAVEVADEAAVDADAPKAVDADAPKAVDAEVVEPEVVVEPGVKDAALPLTDEEAGVLIAQMLDAATAGHWQVFVGLLLLGIVWVFNKLGLAAKVGRQYVPWVTVGIATLVAVSVGLATGAPLLEAFKVGLLEGGIAIALWELVVKNLTKLKSDGEPRKIAA